MRAFPMLRALGYPVVYDVTHSLQLPGAGDGVTAGQARVHRADGLGRRRGRRRRRVPGSPRAARRARRATRRTRCGSTCSSRCCSGSCASTRSRTERPYDRDAVAGTRARAQGPADRGGRHPGAGRPPRRRRSFERAVAAALRVPRPRHRHRHGQVGDHLPQDRGDALEHRHRPRSSCTRPKRSTAISAPSGKTTS